MTDYRKRLRSLRVELKKKGLDAFLVTNNANVTYLSGFTGTDSLLLITPDSQFFLTDSRYTEEARDHIKAFVIVEVVSSTFDTIKTIVRNNRIKKMGIESMNIPCAVFRRLEDCVGRTKIFQSQNIVEGLRAVKDKDEIELIKRSVSLTKTVLKKSVGMIRYGMSELSLSQLIECEFIKRGAKASFQTIVAHGKNCSKPHAQPTDAKITKNDFLMIDMGCRLNSYNSDITRMVLMGRIADKIREIYTIVRAAQERSFEAIRPGIKISEVDRAGRSYIEKKGYGRFFGHSLGHGVGLDIHEEPSISGRNTGVLKPGMVFTVEPAIYIPKFGGVRIEDMVLVTRNGCEILTQF